MNQRYSVSRQPQNSLAGAEVANFQNYRLKQTPLSRVPMNTHYTRNFLITVPLALHVNMHVSSPYLPEQKNTTNIN